MSSEAKVGAVFLLLISLIGGTILFMGGGSRFRAKTYPIKVHFADVHGLERGADVRMAGVRVGRVKELSLVPVAKFKGKPVEVTLDIKQGTLIYDTDTFLVDQSEMLGGRFVSVQHRDDGMGKPLAVNADIANSGIGGYASLPDDARGLIQDARTALRDISGTISSQYNQDQIRQILLNVNRATYSGNLVARKALMIASQLSSIVGKNDPQVAALVENLRRASGNVLATTDVIHKMLALNPLPLDMARAGQEIRGAAQDVHAMTQEAKSFVTDPNLRKQMDTMMANLRQATENVQVLTDHAAKLAGDEKMQGDLRQSLTNIRDATESIKQTTASVQKLLSDEQVGTDLKATVHNARIATERGAELAGKASQSLDRVDRTMDRLGSAVSSIRPKYTTAWINNELALDKGYQGDFNVDMHYTNNPNDFWRVGISDIGGSERLIFQKSLPINPQSRVRAGLLYGKLSVGYDRLWKNSGLEFDLFDPDALTLNARASYRLRKDWDLLLGVDQAFNRNHPFIGARRWLGDTQSPDK